MSKYLYRIGKGENEYTIKDRENENRFSAGVLKVANGGTGSSSDATLREKIAGLLYPVGAIYISADSTDPGTLFGGTWTRIKDKFLLCAGDTYEAAATGGAASQSYTPAGTVGNTTLTKEQMPAHDHSFTPFGSISGGSHLHSYTPSGTISGGAHSHTFTGSAHNHTVKAEAMGPLYIKYGSVSGSQGVSTDSYWLKAGSSYVTAASTDPDSAKRNRPIFTVNTTQGGTIASATPSMSFSGTEKSTGATSPSMTFTGQNGMTGSKGGDGAHNHSFTGTAASIATMPPYLAVYVWQRTA